MTPESAQTEFTALATEVIRLLNENADSILKDHQPSFCGGCAGAVPKFVYRSPAAYRIGQLLDTMRKRGHVDFPKP